MTLIESARAVERDRMETTIQFLLSKRRFSSEME